MKNQEIPSEFPNIYKDEAERRKNWEAFNAIREMFGCPEHLSYKDADDWIASKKIVASINGNPFAIFERFGR